MAEGVAGRVVALLRRLATRKGLVAALKAYGVFAVLHSLTKLLLWYRELRYKHRMLKHLPGYAPDLTAGKLLANVNRLHEWRRDTLMEHRDAQLVRLPMPQIEVMCNKPESIERMLKTDFTKITKPGPDVDYGFKLLGEFLGDQGIFVLRHGDLLEAQNKVWYNQRKTASKIFTKSNFGKLMYGTLIERSDAVIEMVGRAADANEGTSSNAKADGARTLDMQEMFFCFTMDSIQKIFFNRDADTVRGKQDEYAASYDNAHRSMMKHMFAAQGMLSLTTMLLPFPFGALRRSFESLNPGFWLYRNFMEPNYSEFRRHVQTLDRYTNEIVAEARRDRDGASTRRDLLASFLDSKNPPNDKQLHDVILNFIIAGRDTTACTLTWLLFELTQNRDVQDKLAAEVHQVLGADGVPTLDDITVEKMPYMHGVLMEALRLHPPVPEDSKHTLEPITFDDGTVVPAGTKLTFTPYSMGRNPDVYKDPLKFQPERWLGRPDPSMFEFPVFQAGNRYCLGMQLAKNETKLLTSRLVQKFDFHLEASEKPAEFTFALMITMSLCNTKDQSSHELNIVPRRRAFGPVAARGQAAAA